jgi:hypothetical protein
MPTTNPDGSFSWEPHEWREREAHRQASGRRQLPVWEGQLILTDQTRDHYVHASRRSPGMLAYTQSEEKGMRDLHTLIRPGRYLQRFYGHILSPNEINRLASLQMGLAGAAQAPRRPGALDLGACELRVAESPEDIAWVYEHGPGSCMRGYERDEHPCRAYGAGDLAIAYLRIPEGTERRTPEGSMPVVARSVVWPARKLFSRIYPTSSGWYDDGFTSCDESRQAAWELERRRVQAGYALEGGPATPERRNHQGQPCSFEGARLLYVEDAEGEMRLPFIDHDWQVDGPDDGLYITARGRYVGSSEGMANSIREADED